MILGLAACGNEDKKEAGGNPSGSGSTTPTAEELAAQQEQARIAQLMVNSGTTSDPLLQPSGVVSSVVAPPSVAQPAARLPLAPAHNPQQPGRGLAPPAVMPAPVPLPAMAPLVIAPPVRYDAPEFRTNPNPNAYIGSTNGPVISIGDLHGDLNIAIAALLAVQVPVINAHGQWITVPLLVRNAFDGQYYWNSQATNVVVVQVGDQLDRGDQDLALFYFLERLTREAVQYGSHLILLVGNHEVMQTSGLMDYVSLDSFLEFTTPAFTNTFPIPAHFFNATLLINRDLIDFLTNLWLPEFIRDRQDGAGTPIHVSHFPEYHRGTSRNRLAHSVANRAWAFAPGGPLALILAQRSFFAIVNQTLYVHGGMVVPVLDGTFASGEAEIQMDTSTPPLIREAALQRRAERGAPLTNLIPAMTPIQQVERTNQLMRGWFRKERRYSRAIVRQVMADGREVQSTLPGDDRPSVVSVEDVTRVLQGWSNSGYLIDGEALIRMDDPSSPFWIRDFSRAGFSPNEADCNVLFARLQRDLGVTRMAVGHCIQPAIRAVCGGRLWLTDVGLSAGYAGSLQYRPAGWQPQVLYQQHSSMEPVVVNVPALVP
jgi:hypothetical protein